MANWKKIIVSGSEAELDHIKISALSANAGGSPLELSAISGSESTTPLVIDASGNIFTGSAYAKESGGDTVGGSGLSQSVAIVGLNENGAPGSQIQTASSAVPFNLNSSDVQNANSIDTNTITSSNGYGLHTSSFASISGDTLLLGDSYKTVFTSSGIELKSNITASVVPTTNNVPFFLGVSSSGELLKIDQSDVGTSGGSGGSIVKAGTNINVDGTITTQEHFLGYCATNLNSITSSITSNLDNVVNDGTLQEGDSFRLKYSNGTQQDLTISSIEETVDGSSSDYGLTFSETLTTVAGGTKMYQLIEAPTVSTVNVDDTIKVSNIELTGSLSFSGSSTVNEGNIHSIHPVGDQTLNITASNITVDGNLDTNTFSFDGFFFSSTENLITSASTVFGDSGTDTHRFTGSVFFNNDLKFGGDTTDSTATFYAPIISGSIDVGDVNIKKLSGTNALKIATSAIPATEVGFNGGDNVNISLITSGSTFSIGANGLGIAAQGITTLEIENDAVTDDKLSDTGVTGGTYGSTTQIPQIAVNNQGRITSISNQSISTDLAISGDESTTGTITSAETLAFSGSGGITAKISNNTVSIDINPKELSGTKTYNALEVTNDLSVGNNLTVTGTTTLNGNTTIGDNGSDSHTVNGDVNLKNNVDIDGTLNVDGNTTLDNLLVAGTLTVTGDTTTLTTTNLHIEDRFIVLGSGSSNISNDQDSGIIFETGSNGSQATGQSLFYDANKDRLSVAKQVSNAIGNNFVGTSETPNSGIKTGDIVTVRTLSDANGIDLTTTVGTGNTNVQYGSGEMVVDQNNDVWIYTNA